MQRIKYLGKVLSIGGRITGTKWLAVLANITAAAAFLGLALVVPFMALPLAAKIGIPTALLIAIVIEGGFRLWRQEASNVEALQAASQAVGQSPAFDDRRMIVMTDGAKITLDGIKVRGADGRTFVDASGGAELRGTEIEYDN